MSQFLDVEKKNGIGYVSLNRPPVNAFTAEMLEDLCDTLWGFSDDESIAVAVLRSGIARCFSAGIDIKQLRPNAGVNMPGDHQYRVRSTNWRIMECPLPIIAAVNGYALGMGCIIVNLCDFIIAG